MCSTLRNQLINLFTTLLFICLFNISFSATVTAITNNGSWCDGTTWNTGVAPGLNDDIVIPHGVNVLINCVDNNVYKGTLSVYGTMTFSNGKGVKMDDNATVILGSGSLFIGGNSGSGLWIGTSKETDCTVYEGGLETVIVGPATCTIDVCCAFVALPIELANFEGSIDEDGKTHLYWSTATEKNNDYFSIEYSQDGVNFYHIADIQGAGNSTELLSYEWVSQTIHYGISYYRLVQTDIDGKQTKFNPISLMNRPSNDVLMFPNPTNGICNVNYKSESEQVAQIEVQDFYGHVIFNDEVICDKGMNSFQLPSLEWQKGFYSVKMQLEEGALVSKFLKE